MQLDIHAEGLGGMRMLDRAGDAAVISGSARRTSAASSFSRGRFASSVRTGSVGGSGARSLSPKVVAALRACDPEAARRIMREHLAAIEAVVFGAEGA